MAAKKTTGKKGLKKAKKLEAAKPLKALNTLSRHVNGS
jgi:hypothetical protein